MVTDATEKEVLRARKQYQTDCVQINQRDGTVEAVRIPGQGIWLAAWVWLPDQPQ